MEDNQNPGIDTEHERQRLNYRPERYTPEVVRGGESALGEDDILPVFPKTYIETPVTHLDENIQALKELSEKLEERLVNANRSKKVEVPEEWRKDFGEYIGFERYREALDGSTKEDFLVRDIWESFAEDVEGDLSMEYYEDVFEVRRELEQFMPFLEEHVYLPMGMKLGEAERETESEFMKESEVFFEKVKEVEHERKLLILEHDLESISKMEDGLKELRKEKSRIEEVLQTKDEVMELGEAKFSRLYQVLGTIEEALDETYPDGKDYLSKRAKMAIDEFSHKQEVRGMKTLLKLTLDKENQEKSEKKRFNRGHLSFLKRKRLQEGLNDSIWLQKSLNSSYKEILLDEGEDDDDIVSRLVSGSVSVQDELEQKMEAFYQASRDDAQKRLEKVQLVQEKETTRNLYRHVQNRIRELGGEL